MKLLAIVLLAATTCACEADPINLEKIATGNKDVTVDLIAQFDGIKVYRLRDGGNTPVYITDSRTATRANWTTEETTTTIDTDGNVQTDTETTAHQAVEVR